MCPSLEARVQKGRVAAEGPSTGGGDSPRLNLQPDWSCSILDRGDASLKLATQGKLQPYDPSVLPVSAPHPPRIPSPQDQTLQSWLPVLHRGRLNL